MPFPFNLTGAWSADDGGVYFVRHLPDDTVTWAGLHRSGFHLGVNFTNVFMGKISRPTREPHGVSGVLSGNWADVPRGMTDNEGTLSLNVEFMLPTPATPLQAIMQWQSGPSFGARHWTRGGPELQLGAVNTAALLNNVARYDTTLAVNNPPGRDFSVMWGTVGVVSGPTLPPANDYCTFRSVVDGHPFPFGSIWGGDGDFDFDLNPIDWSLMEPDFWTDGWLEENLLGLHFTEASEILALYNQFNERFHCEAAMYGRQNSAEDCAGPAIQGVPGWFETGGDCVLVNGRPLSELEVETVSTAPGGKASEVICFHLAGPGKEVVELKPGARARVTGVVAVDAGHHEWDPPFGEKVVPSAPEIHPVYAIDIAQDFRRRLPTSDVNLSGVWHGSDMATYYVRQLGTSVWWLGLSRDQGRTNANVFHGTMSGQTIQGQWVDIPIGTEQRNLTTGNLMLRGGPLSTELIQTTLSGFPAMWWLKIYDTAIGPPIARAGRPTTRTRRARSRPSARSRARAKR